MSCWTHLVSKAVFRNATEERLREHFGKELRMRNSFDAWEDYVDNKDKYLLAGSEGSLRSSYTTNADGNVEVEIYGSLRDMDDAMGIFTWYRNKVINPPEGAHPVSAKAKSECYPDLIVWHWGEDPESNFVGTC